MPQISHADGWRCRVARHLSDVLEAWRLVYVTYLRQGLIGANPMSLHTTRHHVGEHATVAIGAIGSAIAWTATMVGDVGHLPLENTFPQEIPRLRARGKVIEFGLFASRTDDLHNAGINQIDLMGHLYHTACARGADHMLVGIHPRHQKFWEHGVGMTPIAGPTAMHAVRNHPCVLMHLAASDADAQSRNHRVLRHWIKRPTPAAWANDKYTFPAQEIAGTPLGRYIETLARIPGALP